MIFQIRIADTCIEVHGAMAATRYFCRDYLVQDQVPDLVLHIEESDLERERKIQADQSEAERKSDRNGKSHMSEPDGKSDRNGKSHMSEPDGKSDRSEDLSVSDAVLEPLALYRKIAESMLRFDTFLMHGTVAAIGDAAFMYTASSGTGKTTRARKFLEVFPSAYIVNGDKPLLKIVQYDKMVQCDQPGKNDLSGDETAGSEKRYALRSEVFACGTPWCGKERMQVDRMVPLKAIFLLERSEVNRVQEVSIIDAFPLLYQQTFRPKDPELLNQTLKLIRKLSESVKFYRLACNREADAARLVYRTVFYRRQAPP